MATTSSLDIDSLPLPSTLDLPISLPPINGDSEASSSKLDTINQPLPPLPLPIDEYDYGPSTSTEPQLETSVLADGELPRFDEVNQQYEFLRRTLSHSRRRYSARFKRPRPVSRPRENGGEESTLDAPWLSREPEESTLDKPGRIRPPPRSTHQLHQNQRNKAQSARRPHPPHHGNRTGHASTRSVANSEWALIRIFDSSQL